jgi:hypothetical protein
VVYLGPLVAEQPAGELDDGLDGNPGRAEVGADLARVQVGGEHSLKRGDVARVPGVGLAGLPGDGEFRAYVSGQVLFGRYQAAVSGVVVDELAEFGPRGLVVDAQEAGDLLEVGVAALGEADRQRLSGGVGAGWRPVRGDHALGEDRGLVDAAGLRVDRFEGGEQRPGWVAADAPRDAQLAARGRFAGLRVQAVGDDPGVVDAPIHPAVEVVGVGELGLGVGPRAGFGGRVALGVEDPGGELSDLDQGAELPGFALVRGSHGLRLAVGVELHEGAGDALGQGEAAGLEAGGAADPYPLRGLRRRGMPPTAALLGLGGDLGELFTQLGDPGVGVAACRGNREVGRSVRAAGAESAQDAVWVAVEVLVDSDRVVLGCYLAAVLPVERAGLLIGSPAAQDEQVGHDVGAGRVPVRAGGQADRAKQVGQFVQVTAGGRVAGVQGPGGGQGDEHASGLG